MAGKVYTKKQIEDYIYRTPLLEFSNESDYGRTVYALLKQLEASYQLYEDKEYGKRKGENPMYTKQELKQQIVDGSKELTDFLNMTKQQRIEYINPGLSAIRAQNASCVMMFKKTKKSVKKSKKSVKKSAKKSVKKLAKKSVKKSKKSVKKSVKH